MKKRRIIAAAAIFFLLIPTALTGPVFAEDGSAFDVGAIVLSDDGEGFKKERFDQTDQIIDDIKIDIEEEDGDKAEGGEDNDKDVSEYPESDDEDSDDSEGENVTGENPEEDPELEGSEQLMIPIVLSDQSSPAYKSRSEIELGNIVHYNGLIFNQFIGHQADCEGAMAIGGNAYVAVRSGEGFDFGGAIDPANKIGLYVNDAGYPTVLLNDVVTIGKAMDGGQGGNRSNVHGGPIVMNESSVEGYSENTVKFAPSDGKSYIAYTDDDYVQEFFTESRAEADKTVSVLNNIGGYEMPADEFNMSWQAPGYGSLKDWSGDRLEELEAYGLSGAGSLKVIKIDVETENGSIDIMGPQLTADFKNYDLIIFNFPDAKTVNFTGIGVYIDGQQLAPNYGETTPADDFNKVNVPIYAQKIIWNFPKATSISSTGTGIIGSVLAPNASFDADGGSLNGMLIAYDFETKNSMELHAFTLSPRIFEFEEEPDEPGPGPGPDPDPTASIGLTKISSEDETELLDGAKFLLYYEEQEGEETVKYYYTENPSDSEGGSGQKGEGDIAVTWQTDREKAKVFVTEDGVFTVEDLPQKTYYLVETEAPEGYQLDEGPVELDLNKVTELNLELPNEPEEPDEPGPGPGPDPDPTASIGLTKISSEDETELLDGAKFLLYYEEQEGEETVKYYYTENPSDSEGGSGQKGEGDIAVTWQTDREKTKVFVTEDGVFTVEDLPQKTYYLVETEAPEGYQLDEGPVELDLNKVTELNFELPNEPEEPDEPGPGPGPDPDPTASIGLTKISSEDETELLDEAKFLLYYEEQEGEETVKYYYTENPSDSEGGSGQKGEGDIAVTWQTDREKAKVFVTEDGVFTVEDLPQKTYYLVETEAPEGYQLDEGPVELDLNKVTELNFELPNEPEEPDEPGPGPGPDPDPDPTASIGLTKISSEDETELLDGAKFLLYYEEQEGEETVKYYYTENPSDAESGSGQKGEGDIAVTWQTDREKAKVFVTEDGVFTVEDLPQKTYYLVETEAPEGYQLDEGPVELDLNKITELSLELPNEPEEPDEPETPGGSGGGGGGDRYKKKTPDLDPQEPDGKRKGYKIREIGKRSWPKAELSDIETPLEPETVEISIDENGRPSIRTRRGDNPQTGDFEDYSQSNLTNLKESMIIFFGAIFGAVLMTAAINHIFRKK